MAAAPRVAPAKRPWPPQPTALTADDVVAVGACLDGVRAWLIRHGKPTALPPAEALALTGEDGAAWIAEAAGFSGSGYGHGSGYGDGCGYGSGYGDGSGSGSGYGYGDGYGHGYGDGSGSGDGHGSGHGSGDGHGSGYGSGDGHGSGYGHGSG